MGDELYTVQEVAKILKCNTVLVYKLRDSGILKFLKLGQWKCRKSTLEEFMKKYEGYDISDPFNIKELKYTNDLKQ